MRDAAVIEGLQRVVATNPRWGFWKCHGRLRLDGHGWNHKRVHRVHRALGLHLPRRTRRRVPPRVRQTLVAPNRLNEIWALDFIHDALYSGRRFRTLNVLDEGNREGLAIEVGTSIPAPRVVRVLDQLVALYGCPRALRLDNGPELTAQVFVDWCDRHGLARLYIQPGKPAQNAFIERFNRTFREEVLDAFLWVCTQEVQQQSDTWLITTTSTGPTTRWAGYRRSLTWRASHRARSPIMSGPLDREAFPRAGRIRRWVTLPSYGLLAIVCVALRASARVARAAPTSLPTGRPTIVRCSLTRVSSARVRFATGSSAVRPVEPRGRNPDAAPCP